MFFRKLFCALLLIPGIALASNWTEYQSENFRVYTDERPAQARKVLTEFEMYRKSVLYILGIPELKTDERMTIVMYRNQREYNRLDRGRHVGGFYTNALSGPKMVSGPSSRLMSSSVILFHEYIHYLVDATSDMVFPKWYSEGFAEILASAQIRNDSVLIGAVHPLRKGWLEYDRILPVGQLINPRDRAASSSYWGRFYASAWAFSHLINFGVHTGINDYRPHTRDYLVRINNGEDPEHAFVEAYGITTQQMDRELQRYLRRGSLIGRNIQIGKYEGNIQSRPMNSNEVAFILGDLAISIGEKTLAQEYLSQVDRSKPGAGRVMALSATITLESNQEQALTTLVESLKLAPEDPEVQAYAAMAFVYLMSQTEAFAQKTEWADRAIIHGQRATELSPHNKLAHYHLFHAHAFHNDRISALKSLMAVHNDNPTNIHVNLLMGEYLLDGPSPHLARGFLTRAMNWTHSEETYTYAEKLLAQMEQKLAQAKATP